MENKKIDYKEVSKNIRISLDQAIELLGDIDLPTSTILNLIFPTRLNLAKYYHELPYDEARKYKEQIEIIDHAFEDWYFRQRTEALTVGWKK